MLAMKINEAQTLAVNLMQQHGLINLGWQFTVFSHPRILGSCNYTKKQIKLSVKHIAINPIENVTDTILHEIAHAIAGPLAGHGQSWKAVCIKIGARPVQYATVNTDIVYKYRAICSCCSKLHNSDNKLPVFCNCQADRPKKTFLQYKTTVSHE